MSQITVSLPDPKLEAFVNKVVEKDALGSPSEYIVKLIQQDRRRRAQDRVAELLVEGLESDLIEADEAHWERKDREFDKHYPPEPGE